MGLSHSPYTACYLLTAWGTPAQPCAPRKALLTSLLSLGRRVQPHPLKEHEVEEVYVLLAHSSLPHCPTPAHNCCQLIPEGMPHN